MSVPNLQKTLTVTIGAGASLSGATADLGGWRVIGYITASTWDTQAVSFQVSLDGTNFFNLYYEAAEYTQAGVIASTFHAINPAVFSGARYIKVRSGTAGAAVNQVDATIITLVCSPA